MEILVIQIQIAYARLKSKTIMIVEYGMYFSFITAKGISIPFQEYLSLTQS